MPGCARVPAPISVNIKALVFALNRAKHAMAGLDSDTPIPTQIVLHEVSRVLEVSYEDGRQFRLPFELMRVYSPSAEVRGHGPGQETLQTGKAQVTIEAIEPVGLYAIQPKFSDGHYTGIFSWDYLYWLGDRQDELWRDYLGRLEAAGASREADLPAASGESVMASTAVSRTRAGGCG